MQSSRSLAWKKTFSFCARLLLLGTLVLAQDDSALAQTPLKERLAALHETPNWRFITEEFIQRIENRTKNLQGPPVTVLATLQNEERGRITNAFGLLRLKSNNSLVFQHTPDVFAVAWSDGKGVLRFKSVPTPWFEPAYPLAWELCVFAPSKALSITSYEYLQGSHIERLTLTPGISISGTVFDSEEQPVGGLDMEAVEIIDPYEYADIEVSFLHSECAQPVRTGSNGEFSFGGLPAERIISVSESTRRAITKVSRVATSELNKGKLIDKDRPRSGMVFPHQASKFKMQSKLKLEEIQDRISERSGPDARRNLSANKDRVTIKIQVVDATTGEGIQGIATAVRTARVHAGMLATDKEGKARLQIARDVGRCEVFVMGRRYGYRTHYTRMTTDPNEYTPPIENDEWAKTVVFDERKTIDIQFELEPVPPLVIQVHSKNIDPVQASLTIHRKDWNYKMPPMLTDEKGKVTVPIRPVFFNVLIEARTDDGRTGELSVQLTKQLQMEDAPASVVVE